MNRALNAASGWESPFLIKRRMMSIHFEAEMNTRAGAQTNKRPIGLRWMGATFVYGAVQMDARIATKNKLFFITGEEGPAPRKAKNKFKAPSGAYMFNEHYMLISSDRPTWS